MAIYDCFTFFNELELLELRMELLKDVVDHFVICELDVTHRGEKRSYCLDRNWNRFSKYHDKMIYIKASDAPACDSSKRVYSMDGMMSDGDWSIENYHRNSLKNGLKRCRERDIILVSDIDEIPRPDIIQQLAHAKELDTGLVGLEMEIFYYFLNLRSRGKWRGTVACRYRNMKTPQEMRNVRNTVPHVPNSGWHFSYLGGLDKVKEKLNSIVEGNVRLSEEHIERCLEQGLDLYGRKGPEFTYEFIPMEEIGVPGIERFIEKYPHLYRAPKNQSVAGVKKEPVRAPQPVLLMGTDDELKELYQLTGQHSHSLQIVGDAVISEDGSVLIHSGDKAQLRFAYILTCSGRYYERVLQGLKMFSGFQVERILDGRVLRIVHGEQQLTL